jgi:hypothetical protein
MDTGEVTYIVSTLTTGALAAFFAIMLWSKTRDIAWMLMVIGAIVGYVEIVYSIMAMFGVAAASLSLGSVSAAAILLPNLRNGFFVAAFVVMVVRKLRHR